MTSLLNTENRSLLPPKIKCQNSQCPARPRTSCPCDLGFGTQRPIRGAQGASTHSERQLAQRANGGPPWELPCTPGTRRCVTASRSSSPAVWRPRAGACPAGLGNDSGGELLVCPGRKQPRGWCMWRGSRGPCSPTRATAS